MDLTKAREKTRSEYSLAGDVIGSKVLFVNYYMIGQPGKNNKWVLVDAALPGSANRIIQEAEELYGEHNPPQAIILTHGHFDHVGALKDLLRYWPAVNVYAHAREIPFLTGKSSYPPPDPAVGKGGMAYMSWMFPIKPINIERNLHILPGNGTIPFLPDWRYIHTPGHAPGHISLFRESDRILIAGDAFTTTNQNSVTSVMLQKKEMHGPPAYFTIDWLESFNSIKMLSSLDPDIAGTGHGLPASGQELKQGLVALIRKFTQKEIPAHGRYVKHPAVTDEEGIRRMPAPISFFVARFAAIFTLVALAGFLVMKKR